MKNLILLSATIILIVLTTSCDKTNECEDCQEGTFVYYKQELSEDDERRGCQVHVNAVFTYVADGDTTVVPFSKETVPIKFRKDNQPIRVKLSYSVDYPSFDCSKTYINEIYKLN